MKIAILDLTKHPEPLMTGLQRAGASILDWLAPSFEGAEFKIFDIAEGNDPVPTPEAFDGLIVSGSELGVYDAVPWMPSVRDLLIDTKLTGKPIFGICFGHQIMADVFGGKAKKKQILVMLLGSENILTKMDIVFRLTLGIRIK